MNIFASRSLPRNRRNIANIALDAGMQRAIGVTLSKLSGESSEILANRFIIGRCDLDPTDA